MTRTLGTLLMVLALAVGASAAVDPGSISGYVRNSSGVPQMGATVEVLTASASPLQTYTDIKGHFSIAGLLPGTYAIKVSAPSFLPSLREKVSVSSGASLVVNVTLNTLFEAIQLIPRRATSPEDQDDWKWTLRSMSNRPVLRLADDGPLVVVEKGSEDDRVLKAKVAFIAGSDGESFGTPDMSTTFEVEQSVFGSGTLGFNGNVGYGPGVPAAIFRTTYKHQFSNGSKPEFGLTVRRFATPDLVARHAALQALALSMADAFTIGDTFEFNYGGELQTTQFIERVTAFRPFGAADLHLGKNAVVEYRYSSAVPNMRQAKGFDTAPPDLSESGPRVSLTNFTPQIERSRHHEVSFSQRYGKNKFQVAYYRDRMINPVITGVGDNVSFDADLLPDMYSGTFNYNGSELNTSGVRLVYQRNLSQRFTGTLDYAFGGTLALPEGEMSLGDVSTLMHTQRRHAIAAKLAGTVPGSNTRWITSYRWTSGDALLPIDLFNVSPGQTDPYFNVFIRQPLPTKRFIPAGVEALVDVRNLLAQGYRPVVGQDGRTVYLVQAARSIRGGLSFTF